MLAVPAALTLYLAFSGGGFSPTAPAIAAYCLALLLALRVALRRRPFSGAGPMMAMGGGALALYGIWTLLSFSWSDSPWRAIVELDRVALYALALSFFAPLLRDRSSVVFALRMLTGAIAALCLVSLAARTIPEVWPFSPTLREMRLSYPLQYYNGLGLLAGVGITFSLYLASDTDAPRLSRVLAAFVLPPLSVTLLLTFSRGAVLAAAISLVTYLLIARPRRALAVLLAGGLPSTVVLVLAYRAEAMLTRPDSATGVAQAHGIAIAVALGALAAATGMLLLTAYESKLRERLKRPRASRVGLAIGAFAVVAALGLGLAWFAESGRIAVGKSPTADVRERLTRLEDSTRLAHWRVAGRGFQDSPVIGQGAGTYRFLWRSARTTTFSVIDAHSLYLEALAELGIVGLVLIAVAILTILVGLVLRTRGANRPLFAALFAAALAWALHAGFDWDWELPAVTLWVFALGGAGLARVKRPVRAARRLRLAPRVISVLALLALALLSAGVAASQVYVEESLRAYLRGDCRASMRAANSSIQIIGARPEPYAVLGYCHTLGGAEARGVSSMASAVKREPRNWQFLYGLAFSQAMAGQDARPAANAALRQNPQSSLVRELLRRLATTPSSAWAREVKSLPTPIGVD